MVRIKFEGDSDFFCTLTDARGLSPFYCFVVKHDETNNEYLLQLEILETNTRGEICRLTEAQKEQLESGKYIYKAFGTEEQVTTIEETTELTPVEIGVLVFEETRTEKEYYK